MIKKTLNLLAAGIALGMLACGGDSGTGSGSEDVMNGSQNLQSSSSLVMDAISSSEAISSSSQGLSSSSDVTIDVSSSSETVSSSSLESLVSSSSLGGGVGVGGGSVYDAENNTLQDLRDGKVYKTVVIGNQTWMAENLNYATARSYCYDNDASYCTGYGRLYMWSTAVDSAAIFSEGRKGCGNGVDCSELPVDSPSVVRGVCPENWHLPTVEEWKVLIETVGGSEVAGSALKTTSGWMKKGNGENSFGFAAKAAGYRYNGGVYTDAGYYAHFWSSTDVGTTAADYVYLRYGSAESVIHNKENKSESNSVRCLKD